MKFSDTLVPVGGVYRCCHQSFTDAAGQRQPDREVAEGDELECKYCHRKFKLQRDGSWEPTTP
jgi:hypothetical protein